MQAMRSLSVIYLLLSFSLSYSLRLMDTMGDGASDSFSILASNILACSSVSVILLLVVFQSAFNYFVCKAVLDCLFWGHELVSFHVS